MLNWVDTVHRQYVTLKIWLLFNSPSFCWTLTVSQRINTFLTGCGRGELWAGHLHPRVCLCSDGKNWWNQQMHPLPQPPNWPVNSLFRAAASSRARKGTSHVKGRLRLLFKRWINTQCVHAFMELKETFPTLSEFPVTVGTVWHLKLHEGKVSFLMYINSWSLIYFTCPESPEKERKGQKGPKTWTVTGWTLYLPHSKLTNQISPFDTRVRKTNHFTETCSWIKGNSGQSAHFKAVFSQCWIYFTCPFWKGAHRKRLEMGPVQKNHQR